MRKIEGSLAIELGVILLLCVAAIVIVFNVSAFTGESKLQVAEHKAQSDTNVHAWTTWDRDDIAAGVTRDSTEAQAVCKTGETSARYAEPAAACAAAYEAALVQEKYGEAAQYAAIGCRLHHNPSDCRRVGRLPLVMGNAGVFVPAAIADEMKRTADFVCLSGSRLKSLVGTDVTGRECAYFARQLALASDPEYNWALEPAARAFFERIHDIAQATKFHRIACGQLGYAESCADLRELSQRVVLRELAETTEILEQEAGQGYKASAAEAHSAENILTRR